MEKEYLIRYVCYSCKHEWHEVYSCACDGQCPVCDAKAVTADNYCILQSDTIVFINDNTEEEGEEDGN